MTASCLQNTHRRQRSRASQARRQVAASRNKTEQITATSQADEHHRMIDLPGFPLPSTGLRRPVAASCCVILRFRGLDQCLHEVVKADSFCSRPRAGAADSQISFSSALLHLATS